MWSKQKLAVASIKKQTSSKQSKKPKQVFVLKSGYISTLKGPFNLELYLPGNLSSAQGIHVCETIHKILNV